jgi:hypothetical protein
MKKSENKNFGKNKFYNIYKGKKENGYFFWFPSISTSPKKMLNWDISVFSIFLAWGKYFFQINMCEIIKDTSSEVFRDNMVSLISILKSYNLKIDDVSRALEYLNKNQFIVLLLKNSQTSHPYVKQVIHSYIYNQPFISTLNE